MKKQLFKPMVAALLSVCLSTAMPVQASGIPVFDGARAADAIKTFIQMKEQIDNQVKQLNQMKKQFNAMSGVSNIGQILRDVNVKNLPIEWKDMYSNKALSADIDKVLSGKGYSRESMLKTMVTYQNQAVKELENTQLRLKKIEQLINTINATKDVKTATDLQNRIAGEQAAIQNTQIKLDMMERLYRAEKDIQRNKYSSQQACYAQHMRDGKYDACH